MLLNLCRKSTRTGQVLNPDSSRKTAQASSERDESFLLLAGLAVDHFFDRCEDTVRHTHYSSMLAP
jgi:hypothetical protein